MLFRHVLASAAAAALIAAPIAAQAADRAPSPMSEAEALTRETRLPVLLLLGAFLAVVLVAVVDHTDDDEPASP